MQNLMLRNTLHFCTHVIHETGYQGMILSFASDVAEQIFYANWGMAAAPANYGQLEECFLDLRLLDAAFTGGDLARFFEGRLFDLSNEDKSLSWAIGPLPGSPFPYRILFVWKGANAEKVDVLPSGVVDEETN